MRVDPIDPFEGPADAKVTIIEAFEYKCPYCAFVKPTVDQIVAKYPKDVRVVAKYVLIHGASAVPPAMAACAAAKQGKYAAMNSALWTSIFKMEGGRPMIQEAAAAPKAVKALRRVRCRNSTWRSTIYPISPAPMQKLDVIGAGGKLVARLRRRMARLHSSSMVVS